MEKISYCKGTHDDPSYPFHGTVDYGMWNPGTRMALLFSVVNMQEKGLELQLYPPMSKGDIEKLFGPAERLVEWFERARDRADHHVEIECVEMAPMKVVPTILRDLRALDEDGQHAVLSAIHEVFA